MSESHTPRLENGKKKGNTFKLSIGTGFCIYKHILVFELSSHIQSVPPWEKRRAESAGTFNIASVKLKPRISHNREPRLSKMQLVNRPRSADTDMSSSLHLHTSLQLCSFFRSLRLFAQPEMFQNCRSIIIIGSGSWKSIILQLFHTGGH